ncbi:MAG TPA: ATP-binding cassette domain-containing protein [Acetobacteraceae bacterium]|nr:ATP-binding cassette domain-containing protein [Acetobacteraceae bacterium]
MPPAVMNAVECEHMSLALGGRAILRDVSFAIGDSEFIGVLGPNGAGKTTLMRAILGLIRPSAGSLRVFGAPAARGNPRIGYVSQTGGRAAPRLIGRDVLGAAIGGHRWGLPIPSRATRAEVAHVLDLVGGGALADRPFDLLSGGERQRLLLAQALLGKPQLLLLDEPLVSLDPRHQRDSVELIRALQQELGITVLFSAHELNPLIGALDRVLYLGGGHAALGPVDEVFTGPVLSRLYGTEIEVVRVGGRVFVMSGGQDMEHEAHRHDHDHAYEHR